MIKKKYSYFVAYNIYQDGGYNHCHQITETDYEINFDSGLDGLISHIKNSLDEANIKFNSIILTSVSLLSYKWVWK